MRNGEIILYTSEDGNAVIQLRAEERTVWLTRTEIAELFQTTPQNITLHIQGVYEEGEVDLESTSKDYLLVQIEGKRSVQREVRLYNLNMILAIGYRVRSSRGTQFRKWATTHHTASELIVERSNPQMPNMGLKSWQGSRVRQQDVTIAKNYLEKIEIEELNQIVVMYLDYAENQAKNRKTVTMAEWDQKLDAFLTFNEKDLLNHAGKVSAEVAKKLALERYAEFDDRRRQEEKQIADAEDIFLLEALKEKAKQLEPQSSK